MGEELGDEVDLLTNIACFLAECTASKQSSTPSSPAQLPAPTKSPQHSHAPTGGAQPKVMAVSSHGWSSLVLNPKQGQEERDWTLWITHVGGLQMRCPSLVTPISTGGGRLRPVGAPA